MLFSPTSNGNSRNAAVSSPRGKSERRRRRNKGNGITLRLFRRENWTTLLRPSSPVAGVTMLLSSQLRHHNPYRTVSLALSTNQNKKKKNSKQKKQTRVWGGRGAGKDMVAWKEKSGKRRGRVGRGGEGKEGGNGNSKVLQHPWLTNFNLYSRFGYNVQRSGLPLWASRRSRKIHSPLFFHHHLLKKGTWMLMRKKKVKYETWTKIYTQIIFSLCTQNR